jgi:hypothetical protein
LKKVPALCLISMHFRPILLFIAIRKLLQYYFDYMFMWYFLIAQRGGGGDMRRHVSHSPFHLIRLISLKLLKSTVLKGVQV